MLRLLRRGRCCDLGRTSEQPWTVAVERRRRAGLAGLGPLGGPGAPGSGPGQNRRDFQVRLSCVVGFQSRPIPSLPASTRREAGSTHTLPLILGSSTIPYRAKIRNPEGLLWLGGCHPRTTTTIPMTTIPMTTIPITISMTTTTTTTTTTAIDGDQVEI